MRAQTLVEFPLAVDEFRRALIREHSSQAREDEARFLDALIFNFLPGGTDAHAKKFSLLLAGGGQVRLASCYDLLSILPDEHEPKKVKLAMTIGGDSGARRRLPAANQDCVMGLGFDQHPESWKVGRYENHPRSPG